MTTKPVFKKVDFAATARLVDDYAKTANIPTKQFPAESPHRAGEGASVDEVVNATVPVAVAPISDRTFSVELPDYVIDQINARTQQARPKSTNRYTTLQAFRAIGIDVREADMVPDRRRPGQR